MTIAQPNSAILGNGSPIDQAEPARDSAPAAAWYALGVLIATTLFAFVDRQIINLVAPSFQKSLGISDLQLGVIQGLGLALFASLAAYPIGWLSDRYGRRLVLGCCILVWSISTAACAFQDSFLGLFAATAGIAIGEAALTPVIFSMLPDLFPERQRNTANFIFFGVALLGVAIGLALGGVTLDLLDRNHAALATIFAGFESWRIALILVALPGPLFALLLTTIRMTGQTGKVGDDGRAAGIERMLPFLRRHWRAIACIYGAIFVYGLPLGASLTWLPVALPRAFAGTDPATVGVQMGIAIGVGSIVGLVLPAVGTKFLRSDPDLKPFLLARAFLFAASLPVLIIPFATAPGQVYLSAGMQIACLLATGALMPGVLQTLSPPGLRSRLLSVLGMCSAISGGLAPMLVGMMSDWFDGPRGLFIAMAVIGLPAWLIAGLLMSLARRPYLATLAALRG